MNSSYALLGCASGRARGASRSAHRLPLLTLTAGAVSGGAMQGGSGAMVVCPQGPRRARSTRTRRPGHGCLVRLRGSHAGGQWARMAAGSTGAPSEGGAHPTWARNVEAAR